MLVLVVEGACEQPLQLAGVRSSSSAPDAGSTLDGSVERIDPRTRDGGHVGIATNPAALPECRITAPTLGPSHVALNGVPAAQGGDRATTPPAPYAVTFEVTTSVPNDQTVQLVVSDESNPSNVTTYTATVTMGKAEFAAVPLLTDTTYEVAARCFDKDGDVGASETAQYPVETTAPDLTITYPGAGQAIPPSGLSGDTFQVCGHTSAADAINLPAALGRSDNFCAVTSGRPTCAVATAVGGDVCVNLPCPGEGAFDITATLTDAAGNSQEVVVPSVSCFSTLPMVHIVTPDSDSSPFADPSKRLLAASASQALRDEDAASPGAQTDVVICASRPGTITLLAGIAGAAPLDTIAASLQTRAAVAADACLTGSSFAATFASVTLPESAEDTQTQLVSPTELRADIVDQSGTKNSSPVVHLWVDSIAPVLSLTAPADLCGSYHQSPGVFETTETVTSTAPDVTLTLTTSDFTENFVSSSFSEMTFPSVVFVPGDTHVAGTARDAAGNVGVLQPVPCVVTVGSAPP
ncbi:MAG TPA: hypothetical protein VH560_09455 [Polyangia bacterium]|nr:hypothetical protein [Polyangia bacterium]